MLFSQTGGIGLSCWRFNIGGGITDRRGKVKPNGFKAVQIGGPSGGCLSEEFLDTPIEYENLAAAGSIMGSGGLIVLDRDTCIVDTARYFLSFTQSESCGKCVPCRVGTYHMHEILARICAKEGTENDLALLKELCDMVRSTSLCGLGQSSPNPVLTTLRYFENEYRDLLAASKALPPAARPIAARPAAGPGPWHPRSRATSTLPPPPP